MQFIKLSWNNESKKPAIIYKQNHTDVTQDYYPLEKNNPITITIHSDRYCVGYYDSTTGNMRCPGNQRAIIPEQPYCAECYRKQARIFMSVEALSETDAYYLQQKTNTNYLTIFGNGLLKVGVTALGRKYSRILEQAATAGIFFSQTDGYTARLIEKYVSQVCLIKQSIPWETKLANLPQLYSETQAYDLLKQTYDTVITNISEEYKATVQEAEFHYNKNYFMLSLGSYDIVRAIKVIKPQDTFSGIIKGIFGETILLETTNNQLYAVHTKSIQGYIINLSTNLNTTSHSTPPKVIRFKMYNEDSMSLF